MPDQPEDQPLVSKTSTIVVLVLSAIFFFFMRAVLVSHVPSEDPLAVNIVSSITSLCMTGIFWIASNMFLVTWIDYQRRQKSK